MFANFGNFKRKRTMATSKACYMFNILAMTAAFLVYLSSGILKKEIEFHSPDSAATAATPAFQEHSTPDLLINLSHHKSGTAQFGCIFIKATRALGYAFPKYIDTDITAQDIIKFYTKARLQMTISSKKEVAVLKAGHALVADCYATDDFSRRCPGKCPCKPNSLNSTELEKLCFSTDTTGCHIAVPAVNISFVHTLRLPLDIVISAFLYHSQVPPPKEEQWLISMKTFEFGDWLLTLGVPRTAIQKMFSRNIVLHDFLISIPQDEGVVMEFWWRLYQLYAMARQKHMLDSHRGYLAVRFEDMKEDYNATVADVFSRSGLVHETSKVAAILDAVQSCDPSAWSAELKESSNHVSHADDELKLKLSEALLRNSEIVEHLCTVTQALGYEDARMKGCRNNNKGTV